MQATDSRLERTTRWLTHFGGAALLVGAIDPLEGSVVCVLGSGLLAAASYGASGSGSAILRRRLAVLGLMAFGVVALWIVSAAGGIGGTSGRSAWWALTFLPYPAGWAAAVWERGLPRWITFGAVAVGLWYLVLGGIIAAKSGVTAIIPMALMTAGMGICAVTLVLRFRRAAA